VQSERFYEALQRAGIPSELQLYEKRNHAFDWLFPGERRELFNEMEQWLDSVLLGEEAEAGSP
jgi:dipeptidyl aminopeptidase/acylaminoacyl peptidase